MNKSELIDAIAEKGGLSKSDAGKALDATIASIGEALKKRRYSDFSRLWHIQC